LPIDLQVDNIPALACIVSAAEPPGLRDSMGKLVFRGGEFVQETPRAVEGQRASLGQRNLP
jgi:hypothetical protein